MYMYIFIFIVKHKKNKKNKKQLVLRSAVEMNISLHCAPATLVCV